MIQSPVAAPAAPKAPKPPAPPAVPAPATPTWVWVVLIVLAFLLLVAAGVIIYLLASGDSTPAEPAKEPATQSAPARPGIR
jgi:flagellar basal body-associated protein FliL